MKKSTIAPLIACFALAAAFLTPRARADEWDQRTIVTFSQPVEIPGRVLPAGTYVFRLLDSQSDRNIVEIYNKAENKLYATVIAVPDYRLKPTGKTVITFEKETASSAPERLKAWFYPGEDYGQEFIYPHKPAAELAQTTQPAPPASAEVSKLPEIASAPVIAQLEAPIPSAMAEPEPPQAEAPVEIAQAPPVPPAPQPEPAQPVRRLPGTASDLPLMAVAGLFSLAAAGALRVTARMFS